MMVVSRRTPCVSSVRVVCSQGPSVAQSKHQPPSHWVAARNISSTTILSSDLASFYRIEVSNADRPDATKLTVRGPDIDGILASMTVALAQEGCSLKELHAGYLKHASDTLSYETKVDGNEIEDVFFVVEHETGKPFPDDSLKGLGQSLLDSLKTPMKCLTGKKSTEKELDEDQYSTPEEGQQITVVKGNK